MKAVLRTLYPFYLSWKLCYRSKMYTRVEQTEKEEKTEAKLEHNN